VKAVIKAFSLLAWNLSPTRSLCRKTRVYLNQVVPEGHFRDLLGLAVAGRAHSHSALDGSPLPKQD